jgi:hypothetical protein
MEHDNRAIREIIEREVRPSGIDEMRRAYRPVDAIEEYVDEVRRSVMEWARNRFLGLNREDALRKRAIDDALSEYRAEIEESFHVRRYMTGVRHAETLAEMDGEEWDFRETERCKNMLAELVEDMDGLGPESFTTAARLPETILKWTGTPYEGDERYGAEDGLLCDIDGVIGISVDGEYEETPDMSVRIRGCRTAKYTDTRTVRDDNALVRVMSELKSNGRVSTRSLSRGDLGAVETMMGRDGFSVRVRKGYMEIVDTELP